MPKKRPIVRRVSIEPAIYIHVAGGLKPALTKNSSVAGTVILPMIWGTKNRAQMMRRMLNSLNRLNLSASDMAAPPWLSISLATCRAKSHFFSHEPTPGVLELAALEPGFAFGIERIEVGTIQAGHIAFDVVADL